MVNVDGSLIIQIINFLVLMVVLNMVLYKPIRGILQRRKEKMAGLENRISSCNQEADEHDRAFYEGIKNARAKGVLEKEAFLQAAAKEEKEILSKINKQAQAELAEVKVKVSREAEKVSKLLQKKINSFADDIGQKILGRTI